MINILLVEDSDADAFLIKEAFKKASFDNVVHHLWDGEEGRAFLENEDNPEPDLILLDINMPLMNGHELLKWIKTNSKLKHIPTGMLTTSTAQSDINESYDNHVNYYIVKPLDFNKLQDVINKLEDFWVKTVQRPKG